MSHPGTSTIADTSPESWWSRFFPQSSRLSYRNSRLHLRSSGSADSGASGWCEEQSARLAAGGGTEEESLESGVDDGWVWMNIYAILGWKSNVLEGFEWFGNRGGPASSCRNAETGRGGEADAGKRKRMVLLVFGMVALLSRHSHGGVPDWWERGDLFSLHNASGNSGAGVKMCVCYRDEVEVLLLQNEESILFSLSLEDPHEDKCFSGQGFMVFPGRSLDLTTGGFALMMNGVPRGTSGGRWRTWCKRCPVP